MRSRWLILVGLIAAMLLVGYFQNHDSRNDPDLEPAAVFTVADLPKEARQTLALIDVGGPYPYRQDNGVFGNRERVLPLRPGGYYREFTVRTPGEDDRGPRRLVLGRDGDIFYTDDHYASFRQVERNS